MDLGFLGFAAVGVVLIIVVSFLVRSFMKFILIGVIVYFLFHFGFIWGVGDLNDKLHLDRFLNKGANEKLQSAYGNFADKRNENAIVNTDEVKKAIDEALQKSIEEAGHKLSEVDREALLKQLKEKLQSYDVDKVNAAIDQSQEMLKQVMTKEQIETIQK